MKMFDLINFTVAENHVEADGCKVYFLRILPPDLNIMTDKEKGNEIARLQEFFESLIDQSFQIFSLDKTENLSGNKAYWSSLLRTDDLDDPCEKIKRTIIGKIDSIESSSSSVGRAFYFVLKVKEAAELTRFETTLSSKSIPCAVADKQELVTVLRNYILREFVPFDIYDFESEVAAAYENAGVNKKAAG